MKFTVATLFFATALAGVARRQAPAFCPPGLLYTNPQCCQVDVLGLADLDCVVRKSPPCTSVESNKAFSNPMEQLLAGLATARLLEPSASQSVVSPSAVPCQS